MKSELEHIFSKIDPSVVITKLSPFLTENRLSRIISTIQKRIKSITVCVDSPSDIHNALAIVRTCEAMGVAAMHIIDETNTKASGKRSTMGSKRWIDLHRYQNFKPFYQFIKFNNYLLAGAHPRGKISLSQLPSDAPICLLFGSEKTGLSQDVIDLCDITYQIPMFGMVESYNLSVSAAISLYDVVNKKRGKLLSDTDMNDADQQRLKAVYIMRSLGLQKSKKYLKI